MNRRVAAALLLCSLAGVIWYLFSARTPKATNTEASTPAANPSLALVGIAEKTTPVLTPASAPDTSTTTAPSTSARVSAAVASSEPDASVPAPPPGLPPAAVLENMRMAVREYGLTFAGNPVGTNPEITRALNGGNPRQIKFIRPEAGLQINGKGELVDPWGTPYFFHQLSAMEMEIHSAGPDKRMWTDDDLVIR